MFETTWQAALITTAGSVVATYLTVKYRQGVLSKSRSTSPKDRMDTVFSGYEALIHQQQVEINRLSRQLDACRDRQR
jgi:hypothetical protein